jgi:hypothetical protein
LRLIRSANHRCWPVSNLLVAIMTPRAITCSDLQCDCSSRRTSLSPDRTASGRRAGAERDARREGLPAAASTDWRQRHRVAAILSRHGKPRLVRRRAEALLEADVSLDAVSKMPGPCRSSRPPPAIPRDALRAGARAGRRSIRRTRERAGVAERVCTGQGNQKRGDEQVCYRQHQRLTKRIAGNR